MKGRPAVSALWVVTSLFAAAALYFTVVVEQRRVRFSDEIDLSSGDEVEVKRILDGDELEVAKDGQDFPVRIVGLKCFEPDVNEPGIAGQGQACKAELEGIVGGRTVTLHYDGELATDHDQRVLAYVHADTIDVGKHLVTRGFGMAFTKYPFSREQDYRRAQHAASVARIGLWAVAKTRARAEALDAAWASARSDD